MEYTTEVVSLSRFLREYDYIWRSATYVRTWWWPYTRKVVIWRGNRVSSPLTPPQKIPAHIRWWKSLEIGRKMYEMNLYLVRNAPSLLPMLEKARLRSQFPEPENRRSKPVVANPHEALQADCFFSQYVDEWAIPLSSGPTAIERLEHWIIYNGKTTESTTSIPIANQRTTGAKKVFIHFPIEIRVVTGTNDHAFLSPASHSAEPLVYIGLTMYRPYYHPTAYRRYFAECEQVMRDFNGKPHLGKHLSVPADEARRIFGEGLERWLRVREKVDPNGMFVNGYVRRHLLGEIGVGVGMEDGEKGRMYKNYRAVL
jgi:D-arabinono-1,4-lactone oxidase